MSHCKDLFIAASELSPSARGEFLELRCGNDDSLRAEVEKLLVTLDASADFLETPAIRRPDATVGKSQIGPGCCIGPYTIAELLGEGGMGVVWKAEQVEPVRRSVALKLLKPGLESRQVIDRFEAERRALERMDHPNIAKVLDAGTTDEGRPFVVMELVRGTAVTRYCDSQQLGVHDRMHLFVPVCRAVQHAHSKGVIHRDLKPSNILVCEEDGHATPKIIDFGIARSVERSPDEASHTRALLLLGTPPYVSPEQALKGSEVDMRTDVYSLGAVLYELIGGAPPFDPHVLAALPADALLRTLREDDPPRPSRRVLLDRSEAVAARRGSSLFGLQRQLKGDIDRIVMKALDKEPSRRYETAAALADDLERCLRHDPVMATDPSTRYVATKFVRRHRAAAVTTLLVLACLIVGTIVSWLLMTRAVEAEYEVRIALDRAKANEQRYRRQAFISDMNLADDALRNDDPKRLREILDFHVPDAGETDLRDFAWHFLRRRSAVTTRTIDRIEAPFYYVTFSPDRTTLAAAAADGKVRFYNARTFQRIRSLDTKQGEVNSVVYSPDGTQFVTAGDDGSLKIWDAKHFAPLRTIQAFDERAFQTIFINVPDGVWIAANGDDPEVRLFDAVTGEPRGKPLKHGRPVEAMAASAEGLLATGSEDSIPRVWNVATGELLREGPDTGSHLISVAFSPGGRWVMFGMVKPEFLIWDLKSDSPPRAFPTNSARPGDGEAAQSIVILGVKRSVALADRGGVIRIVEFGRKGSPTSDLTQGRHPHWAAHQDRIYWSAATRNGRLIVTAGRDGLLKASMPFHDRLVPNGENTGVFPSLGAVSSISAGPSEVISVGSSEGAFLVDLNQQSLLQVAEDPKTCDVIAHSDDLNLVVGGNSDVGLVAWQRNGEQFKEIWRHPFQGQPILTKIRLTRDGRYLAALVSPRTDESKSVVLIDASNGKELTERPVPGSWGLDVSPDGRLIAVGQDSDVLVLSLPTFDEVRRLKGHRQSVPAIRFSPDGTLLATGAGDRKAIVWNTSTWEPSSWVAAGGELQCISFTPDGLTLLTGSRDHTPALWDLRTKRLLMHLPKLEGDYWPLRFTGSGGRIVGVHPESGLYVFDGRPMKADDAEAVSRR